MKQLILTFMAVGMLATASWAGSEVELKTPITPEHETACTVQATELDKDGNVIRHYSVTRPTCDEARAEFLTVAPAVFH